MTVTIDLTPTLTPEVANCSTGKKTKRRLGKESRGGASALLSVHNLKVFLLYALRSLPDATRPSDRDLPVIEPARQVSPSDGRLQPQLQKT
jgi:hypothetical protein